MICRSLVCLISTIYQESCDGREDESGEKAEESIEEKLGNQVIITL